MEHLLSDKKLLIFDCDGVLFHSEEANIAYFEECLRRTNQGPLDEELRAKAAYMAIAQLFSEIISDPQEAAKAYEISQAIPYDPYLSRMNRAFDFEEVLLPLKEQFFLAVASNRSISLTKIFRHFDLFDFFHFKVSARDRKPKPAPDMLLACLDYFGFTASEAIFIGDAVSDAEAAKNGGIDYIHVGNDSRFQCISSVASLFSLQDAAE